MNNKNGTTKRDYKDSAISVLNGASVLNDGLGVAEQLLTTFAGSANFANQMSLAFGQNIDVVKFQKAWASADFQSLPMIVVRSASDINGANGAYAYAYAEALNVIFLSEEFLSRHANHPESVAAVLVGGLGKDILKGNGGNDTFDFNALNEMGTSSSVWDVISDFNSGDRIDLSTLDANTATGTNDAFTGFIASTATFTTAGQLKFSGGVLYGNVDSDASAEFSIALTGVTSFVVTGVIL